MKRAIRLVALGVTLISVLSLTAISFAKAPTKTKQLVYGMDLYQGKGFSSTFAPKNEQNISMAANRGNVISPKVTMVYYWPITGEYMADWDSLNQVVGGKLQVLKDGKVIKTISKVDTGFYYPNGYYDDTSRLLIGKEAEKEYQSFDKAVNDYYTAQSNYYKEQQEFEDAITEILQQREQGKKITNMPKAPQQPKPPLYYVTKPYEAYVLDLPVGNYTLRMISSDGKVVKDSEKKLRVVKPRRTGSAYDIIPESKWTTPVKADQPSNVIYYTGKRVLYFQPYSAEEFSQYDFMKITKLHMPSSNNGAKDAWSWIYGDSRKNVKVQVLDNGKVISEEGEKPFYVEQAGTNSGKYNIVPYIAKNYPGTEPTFKAHKISVNNKKQLSVRLVDSKGKVFEGSERELRAIKAGDPKVLLYASLFPLLVGSLLILLRRFQTGSSKHSKRPLAS